MKKSPTALQRRIAKALGVNISGDTERVAAARIREFVAPAMLEKSYAEQASEKQVSYGVMIGLDLSGLSKGLASAMIDDRHAELNAEALQRLALKPGDEVVHTSTCRDEGSEFSWETNYIVSSIGKDGLVYFKGGNGRCGWPTQIRHKNEEQAGSSNGG
jgi:hypothetical protein